MITKSQSILLEALKSSLFNVKPQYPSDVNWNEVVYEAKAQTVMGLLSPVIPTYDESCDQSKAAYMRIMYEQDRLLKCFDAAQIPCVILKGSAAATYYSKPFLRTMGDIDVLVSRDRFKDSLEVLDSNGYIYVHGKDIDDQITNDTRELVYMKNGTIIEIHQRFSSPGVDIDDILEAAIERREFCRLNSYIFPMLPSNENGLVLLGHINQHLKNNYLGLRQIIDWAMYVHTMSNDASWRDTFIPLVDKNGLLTLAAYVTRLCNKHLGLPDDLCLEINVDDILVDELLEVVLTNGNFGRKVLSDYSDGEKRIISASYGLKRYGFFGYFTRVGLETSRFCNKHSSFKVFAFFFGFFRLSTRAVRAFFKKRVLAKNIGDIKMMYGENSARQKLYDMLGVRQGKE